MAGTPQPPPQQQAPSQYSQSPQYTVPAQGQGYMRVERKKPWLAALLGILICGTGLMYVGKWAAGILLLLVAIIVSVFTGGLAAPIFWIISCVWAYSAAKGYNRKAGYPE